MRRSCESLKMEQSNRGKLHDSSRTFTEFQAFAVYKNGAEGKQRGHLRCRVRGSAEAWRKCKKTERNPMSILDLFLSTGCALWLGEGHNHQVTMPQATVAWLLHKPKNRAWKLRGTMHILQTLPWVQGNSLCIWRGDNRLEMNLWNI